jgi:hypothetical protein
MGSVNPEAYAALVYVNPNAIVPDNGAAYGLLTMSTISCPAVRNNNSEEADSS